MAGVAHAIRQVTSKRQVTIPKAMFEAVGIGELVEMSLVDGGIVIRPSKTEKWSIAAEIITDLVAEGVTAQHMAEAFLERQQELAQAVDRINAEVERSYEAAPDSGRKFLADLLVKADA